MSIFLTALCKTWNVLDWIGLDWNGMEWNEMEGNGFFHEFLKSSFSLCIFGVFFLSLVLDR